VPKAAVIGMLENPTNPAADTVRRAVRAAADKLGRKLVVAKAVVESDIEPAFATLAREKVDALHVFGQPFLFAHGQRVAALATEHKLPAMIPFVEVVKAGLLMSFGDRLIDSVRRLPHYIDRILKGASPAELPVEQSARFYLTLNLKTARAIGLTIPQGLLLRADELID
jgi:putative ABC transport system substrate-binding protein